MKTIDKLAFKYIEAQARLNDMIQLNKRLCDQIDTLIEINKELKKRLSLKK